MISDAAVTVGHPDEVLGRIADLMVANGVGRVPIVERGSRRVVGLVARKDLLHIRSIANGAERDRKAYLARQGV